VTCVKGAILHVEKFPGDFGPCDKFVFVLGHASPTEVIVFTISSQDKYTQKPQFAREMVHVPLGTFRCLPKESWIQCFFHPIVLRTDQYTIEHKAIASTEIIEAVRSVIQQSDILNRFEINDCLDILG
jgi:hypothetical protein